jgi:hypothetical protein
MDILSKFVTVLALALIGTLTYFIVQGNLIPMVMPDSVTIAWNWMVVAVVKNLLPLAIITSIVIGMIVAVFGQRQQSRPTDPYSAMMRQQSRQQAQMRKQMAQIQKQSQKSGQPRPPIQF